MARGIRFAPSPTGRFHIGNLRTAWISWTLAQSRQEPWVVRVEDIDRARVVDGAWDDQRQDLERLGMVVNTSADQLIIQSLRHTRHQELFAKARAENQIYPCDCSRKMIGDELAAMATAPHGEPPQYTGRCRVRADADHANGLSMYQPQESLAWRWRRSDNSGGLDAVIGRTRPNGTEFNSGYHWACAIDDADGDYLALVRAWDLASSEPIQREIRQWVNPHSTAQVFHTSLVTRDEGGRLEKRTAGVTLAELFSRGETAESVLHKFSKSFDLSGALQIIEAAMQSGLVGEPKKVLRLSEIGF